MKKIIRNRATAAGQLAILDPQTIASHHNQGTGHYQELPRPPSHLSRVGDFTRISRRDFLTKLGLVACGLLTSTHGLSAHPEKEIRLYHMATGESLQAVYWTPKEGYIDSALDEISWLMRDHHNDANKRIDRKLVDQLYDLQAMLAAHRPVHVMSGYRSAKTNAKLRRVNKRVAKNSYHLHGMAADIRIPDYSTDRLKRAALSLKAGGVGRYATSRFIHVDTGPVRAWTI